MNESSYFVYFFLGLLSSNSYSMVHLGNIEHLFCTSEVELDIYHHSTAFNRVYHGYHASPADVLHCQVHPRSLARHEQWVSRCIVSARTGACSEYRTTGNKWHHFHHQVRAMRGGTSMLAIAVLVLLLTYLFSMMSIFCCCVI